MQTYYATFSTLQPFQPTGCNATFSIDYKVLYLYISFDHTTTIQPYGLQPTPMKKLSVKDYAIKHGVSSQAVYKKIKAGQLETIKENRKTFIVLDEIVNIDKQEASEHNLEKQEKKEKDNQIVFSLREIIKSKSEENSFLKSQITIKDEQIRNLNIQLSSIVEWQREATDSQKQTNSLIAGLQNALGLLGRGESKPVVVKHDDVHDEVVDNDHVMEEKKEPSVRSKKSAKKTVKKGKKKKSKNRKKKKK
ncbi:MAG: hypothetical protein HQK84_11390 [Nitrospinae bacterium]|nr:hypothetical protein [Nitrospinota bacterium]